MTARVACGLLLVTACASQSPYVDVLHTSAPNAARAPADSPLVIDERDDPPEHISERAFLAAVGYDRFGAGMDGLRGRARDLGCDTLARVHTDWTARRLTITAICAVRTATLATSSVAPSLRVALETEPPGERVYLRPRPMYSTVVPAWAHARPLCVAPCEVQLDPGRYDWGVTLEDGAPRFSDAVDLSAGGAVTLRYESHRDRRILGLALLFTAPFVGGAAAAPIWAFGTDDALAGGFAVAAVIFVAAEVLGVMWLGTGDEVIVTSH